MRFSKFINPMLFLTLCLIWGSSFILIKLGLYTKENNVALTAYQVAALRIVSAGIILIPFFLIKIRRFPIKTWCYIFASGLSGVFVPAFLFCVAETRISSALAGSLNSLTPFFVILVGALFYKNAISWGQVSGIIIGFVGIIILFELNGNISFKYLSYGGYILLATISYGINANIVKHELKDILSMTIVALGCVSLIIPGLIILWFTGYFSLPLSNINYLKASGASCILGIIGSALAWILFYILIKRSNAVFASSISFVVPIVALAWGWLYGEPITLIQIICLLIILTGVYLINPISKRKLFVVRA